MNLEKYKKFLDGLGTLKGISDPPVVWVCSTEPLRRRLLRGLQRSPTICHRSPIEANRVVPHTLPGMPRSCRLPMEATGRGGAFHGSA